MRRILFYLAIVAVPLCLGSFARSDPGGGRCDKDAASGSSTVGKPGKGAGESGDLASDDEAIEEVHPMMVNAACCVCHIPFVREELGKVHAVARVTCIKCHGLSAGHANDEDVGATKPDVYFARKEVGPMCRKCHENHDVPPEQVVARFVERRLPPKRKTICTDCHGSHKIERPKFHEQQTPGD